MARYRKNVKRIDPRYFLHETATRGEEERESGVGGQPPEWERKLAKSDDRGPTVREASRRVHKLVDPNVDVEKLGEWSEFPALGPGEKRPKSKKLVPARKPGTPMTQQQGADLAGAMGVGAMPQGPDESDEEYQARLIKGGHRLEVPALKTALEEECPFEDEGGEVIDISAPGTEVHVDDISQLSPEEAFAVGMAAARDAIDQAMGAPDGPPPEGGFSGNGPWAEPGAEEE